MSRKKAIQDKLPELLDYFSSREAILTVFVFGSFGTEQCTELSDLDLAIIFNRKVSLMEEMKISADLSLILGRDDVDVVNLNEARVDLCHEILYTGEIIYERDKIITADFIENALKRYFDYGLTLKKIKEDFWEQLREEA